MNTVKTAIDYAEVIAMRKVFLSYRDREKEEKRGNLYKSLDTIKEEMNDEQEIVEVHDSYYDDQMYGYIIIDRTNCPYDIVEQEE